MHLWPSLRIRDSFKHAYLDKIEHNLRRMKQQRDRPSSDPLLANSSSSGAAGSSSSKDQPLLQEPPSSYLKMFGMLAFCSDLLLLLSCCFCCFCCGACDDEKENRTGY